MTAVLDAGALIGIDRRDRTVGALLRVLQAARIDVRTSAGAAAQVWRDGSRQAALARALQGIDSVALDDAASRSVGALLRTSGTADVIDAHVALLVPAGGQVLTSDVDDLTVLLRARRVEATVVRV